MRRRKTSRTDGIDFDRQEAIEKLHFLPRKGPYRCHFCSDSITFGSAKIWRKKPLIIACHKCFKQQLKKGRQEGDLF